MGLASGLIASTHDTSLILGRHPPPDGFRPRSIPIPRRRLKPVPRPVNAMRRWHTLTAMSHRSTARLVGALFIAATGAGVLSLVVQPRPGGVATTDPAGFATTGLLELVMAVAIAAIPIAIYPVIRRFSERLAIGYVVARAIEAVIVGIDVMLLLTISTARQDSTGSGLLNGLLDSLRDGASVVLTMAFVVGVLVLNLVLYRGRLVPRWLAGWGIFGMALYAAGGVLALYGEDPLSATIILLDVPLAVQEMALAVYLIVRGFSESALAGQSGLEAHWTG